MALPAADVQAILAAQAAHPLLTQLNIPLLGIAQRETGTTQNPDQAVSSSGAVGLFQIKPSTASDPGYDVAAIDPTTLNDPSVSANFAASYIEGKIYQGYTPEEAIAQYNGNAYTLTDVQAAAATASVNAGIAGPYTNATNPALYTDSSGNPTTGNVQSNSVSSSVSSALGSFTGYIQQGGIIFLGVIVIAISLIFLLIGAKTDTVTWKELEE